MMKKEYNWIQGEIEIDFPLPSLIQDLVDELELLDQEKDDLYFDRSEFLEHCTKEYIYTKELTMKQRDLLLKRYE